MVRQPCPAEVRIKMRTGDRGGKDTEVMSTLHVAFRPCCYGGEDFLPPVMSNFARMEVAHGDPATGVSGLLLALTDNHKPAVQRIKSRAATAVCGT